MTTTQTNPIIESHRLSDDEAADLEQQIGCLVARLSADGTKSMTPAIIADDHDAACRLAVDLKKQDPDRSYAVYRPSRVYGNEETDAEVSG